MNISAALAAWFFDLTPWQRLMICGITLLLVLLPTAFLPEFDQTNTDAEIGGNDDDESI